MNIKIAIVDDNSFLRKMVEEKLSFFEDLYVKFIAVNGSDALDKLEENHIIDLILMDFLSLLLSSWVIIVPVVSTDPAVPALSFVSNGFQVAGTVGTIQTAETISL